jgi:hypothetical protein
VSDNEQIALIANCWRRGCGISQTRKDIQRGHGFTLEPESIRLVFVDLAGARDERR